MNLKNNFENYCRSFNPACFLKDSFISTAIYIVTILKESHVPMKDLRSDVRGQMVEIFVNEMKTSIFSVYQGKSVNIFCSFRINFVCFFFHCYSSVIVIKLPKV